MRFCVDYCQLNSVTRKDAYAFPCIDETLRTFAGSCIFTTPNLLSGYCMTGGSTTWGQREDSCLHLWGIVRIQRDAIQIM